MDTDLARFAFELAIRRLEQQERSVSELRARTGTVLGASAITASVLGVRTVGVDRSRALFVSGLGAFVVSVLASILVLLPLSGLVFAVRSSAVAESERDDPDGIGETWPTGSKASPRRTTCGGASWRQPSESQPRRSRWKLSSGQSSSSRGEHRVRKPEASSAAPARPRCPREGRFDPPEREEVVALRHAV